MEGEYPNYELLIPKSSAVSVTLKTELFIQALRRVSLLSSNRFKGVNFYVREKKIQMEAENPELGSAKDEVACLRQKGQDLQVRFNAGYVLDALSSVEKGSVVMRFGGRGKPLCYKPGKGKGTAKKPLCDNAHENVMFLETLEASHFRNYSHLHFAPALKTWIVGDNAQGKTNLLEALVVLTCGRSFRVHQPQSLVQEGKHLARISAEIYKENKKSLLRLSLNREGQKSFWLNGKKTRASRLSEELPWVLFSPESLNLLKGPSEQRRFWLDHWLSMKGQGALIQDFKKVLRQKTALLKQIKSGEISGGKSGAAFRKC